MHTSVKTRAARRQPTNASLRSCRTAGFSCRESNRSVRDFSRHCLPPGRTIRVSPSVTYALHRGVMWTRPEARFVHVRWLACLSRSLARRRRDVAAVSCKQSGRVAAEAFLRQRRTACVFLLVCTGLNSFEKHELLTYT